jgi:RNA recognition motif-containing protein
VPDNNHVYSEIQGGPIPCGSRIDETSSFKKRREGMKLYVGNLSYDTSEEELRKAFAEFGTVDSVTVVMDKYTGKSKGFAFVEMGSREQAQAAMTGLNGKQVGDRTLKVDEARPKPERRGGGGGDRGGGRGGYGGRRDRW